MRKFKFVGTEKNRQDYNRLNESGRPVYGKVYDETDRIHGGANVLHWAEHYKFSHEWKEVFDTIEDKITELKELAKSKGMDCEVVLKEAPKRLEVNFGWTTRGSDRVVFDFFHRDQDKPSSIGVSLFEKRDYKHIKKCGDFLAKQLETYLNENK